ncbi:hypothetical protein L596_022481 [Steinernema carpocapsae]|uniref:Uncharacterized protein n=1 Tax=Steinernema carpocapsae TaxID=34508 RepID=A0A4U5MM82_STECR|nr:hypothetical protein L596_022481 [Steinernema carpocapsae]
MFNNKGSFFVGSEKQSEPVPIGSFLWSADNSRECALIDQRDQLCTILTCRPKEDSPTLLWTCLAKASFSHEDRTAPKEAVYHMWVGRFDHKGMEVHVHSERSSYRAAYRAISPSPAYALPLGKVEIQIINGLHSLHCDFSSSKNLFVQGSEAVKIKVEGKELHIAKKVFDEAIPKDFEKKAKNVKLDKFLYYLGAANGVRVTSRSLILTLTSHSRPFRVISGASTGAGGAVRERVNHRSMRRFPARRRRPQSRQIPPCDPI